MPFDMYKSRVKIVRDEEVVKKWIDDQSFKTEYLCLNMPEPLRLGSMEAVEKHFREQHKENIIKAAESHTLSGTAARSLRSPQLVRLVRTVWEDQRRFPLQIATVLSQQFAGHGLQFFKVNKTITHVAVARPHYLDLEATPVSEGVKRIVDYINAHPGCTRRQLLAGLAPSPAPAVAPATHPAPPGTVMLQQPAAGPVERNEPTPEQTAVIADLHWLIHQGHVLEFANGRIETAKKPAPKPSRPEARPAEAGTQQTAAPTETAASSPATANAEPAPQMEVVPERDPVNHEPAHDPLTPDHATSSPDVEPHAETAGAPPEPLSQTDAATTQS